MRTWDYAIGDNNSETLDLPDYETIGGMAGALSRHADEVYQALPNDHARALAEKLFKAITDKGLDNRSRRRPSKLAELRLVTGTKRQELSKIIVIIEAFRLPGRTFLMPPHGVPIDEHSMIDISHESLIRQWQRLKQWVEEEAITAARYRADCYSAAYSDLRYFCHRLFRRKTFETAA